MSRSQKKQPFSWLCHTSAGEMKKWKSDQNRKIRRNAVEEMPNGNYYRRKNDIWSSPSDGKCYISKDRQEREGRK